MAYVLINGFETTLQTGISNAATSISIDSASAAKISGVTSTSPLPLVIGTSTSFEIVYVTSKSGTTLTVTRAREGTTAQTWSAGTKVVNSITRDVAGSFGGFPVSAGNNLNAGTTVSNTGTYSVAIGNTVTNSNLNGVAIGNTSKCLEAYATAVGYNTTASGFGSMALGTDSLASGTRAVALGSLATTATGADSVAIGNSATASAYGTTVVGTNASANFQYGTSMGFNADCTNEYAAAYGTNAYASGNAAAAIGPGTSATNTRAVCVGSWGSATGDSSVFLGNWNGISSGHSSIAIGNNTSATTDYAIAIGGNAQGTSLNSVSIGRAAVAGGHSAISIGYTSKCYTQSCVIGQQSLAMGLNGAVKPAAWVASTAYSKSSDMSGFVTLTGDLNHMLKCVWNGTSGTTQPVVGNDKLIVDGGVVWLVCTTNSTSFFQVVVGQDCTSTDMNSVALGTSCTSGTYSQAIGAHSQAVANSTALGTGCKAYHSNSLSIGSSWEAITHVRNSMALSGVVSAMVYPPNWYATYEWAAYTGVDSVIMTESFDLTGGTTWAANTPYKHGYVVKPSTPNGCQYVWYDYEYDGYETCFAHLPTYVPASSGPTEPVTWTTVDGSDTDDSGGNGSWICRNNSAMVTGPLPADFVVTKVGIIVYEASGVTVQPTISFGTSSNHTLFVNNQQTTNLTAAKKVQFWNISDSEAVPDLCMSINTLATGTKLLCRAVWHGYYVKHWL